MMACTVKSTARSASARPLDPDPDPDSDPEKSTTAVRFNGSRPEEPRSGEVPGLELPKGIPLD